MSDIDTAPVRNRPTATVRGIASLPVDADFASISIDIEFHHRFRSEAIELAALEVASFRSDFASSSLVRALRLGQMSVRQSRHWDSDTNTYVEGDWEASVRGHLEIATDDVDVVIAAIVDHPVTIGYVSWRLDDDNPAHREVRRLAVGRARDAAEDFASGAGLAVGAVIALADPELLGVGVAARSVESIGEPMSPMMLMDPSDDGFDWSPDIALDPQPVTIHAVIEAVYELTTP